MEIPYFRQQTDYTCGPACMRMAFAAFGLRKSEKALAKQAHSNARTGTDNFQMPLLAECHKMSYAVCKQSSMEEIKEFMRKGYVVIVNYFYFEDGGVIYHFAVVKGITSKEISLLDPELGKNHSLPLSVFMRQWKGIPRNGKAGLRWFLAVKKTVF